MAAPSTVYGGPAAVEEQTYRDFINDPAGGGAIKIYANAADQTVLATYVNLGHNKQYTPSYEQLNGLYALEVSLQAICVRLKVPTPDLESLRDLYNSESYEEAVQLILGSGLVPFPATQMRSNLTETVNLTRDALRLVLVMFAIKIKARLRLGVLSSANDGEGRVWHAVTYPELLPSLYSNLTPYTVWVIDDAGFHAANPEQAPHHWSGLAPEPLYADPMHDPAIQVPSLQPQLPHSWANLNQAQTTRQQSVDSELTELESASENETPKTKRKAVPADLKKYRTAYPSHLTEEQVLHKYPDKMSMEPLLYVLRRYKQGELLDELEKHCIFITSATLRQRKKAALENRARVQYGLKNVKSRYGEINRKYNEEIAKAGYHAPRAERGGNKRKRSDDDEDDDDEDQEEQRSKRTKGVRFNKINSVKASRDDLWTLDSERVVIKGPTTRAGAAARRSSRNKSSSGSVGQQSSVSVKSPPRSLRSTSSEMHHQSEGIQDATVANQQPSGSTAAADNYMIEQSESPVSMSDFSFDMPENFTDEQFKALMEDFDAEMAAATTNEGMDLN